MKFVNPKRNRSTLVQHSWVLEVPMARARKKDRLPLSPPHFLVAEKPGHANHLESSGDLNLTVTWHYSITLPWSLENLSELHAVNINIYRKPIMNSQSAGRTSRTRTHSAHQPMVRAIRVDSNIVVVGHVL